jgi:hypothetical protein
MNRKTFLMVSLALLSSGPALADPIHAVADGAFWHHDSGWVFPESIAGFARVGIPQDVAGSRDAVAHYALDVNGVRIVASVDVYPSDSAAAHALPAGGPYVVSVSRALTGTRSVELTGGDTGGAVGFYCVSAGEWRVSIRISSPLTDAAALMDAFVLGQRWETLNTAT